MSFRKISVGRGGEGHFWSKKNQCNFFLREDRLPSSKDWIQVNMKERERVRVNHGQLLHFPWYLLYFFVFLHFIKISPDWKRANMRVRVNDGQPAIFSLIATMPIYLCISRLVKIGFEQIWKRELMVVTWSVLLSAFIFSLIAKTMPMLSLALCIISNYLQWKTVNCIMAWYQNVALSSPFP